MSRTAEGYLRWAEIEARGSSPIYESWALAVSESDTLIRLIDDLPNGKRQPNLVFAAARWNGIAVDCPDIVQALTDHWAAVMKTVLARSTQTNEPARSAALLFALDRIEGPIALIEVGASAGLCLILDRYDYRLTSDVDVLDLASSSGSHLHSIECAVEGTQPPLRLPDIRWRSGVDLNPVDLNDQDERTWLETLIWPEHHDRRERFRLAATEWSRDPPDVIVGDVLDGLESVSSRVPRGLTTVVMHSALLAYLSPDSRARATEAIRAVADHWISLEGAEVLPDIAAALPRTVDPRSGELVLALDSRPIGLSAPHGGRFEAFTR